MSLPRPRLAGERRRYFKGRIRIERMMQHGTYDDFGRRATCGRTLSTCTRPVMVGGCTMRKTVNTLEVYRNIERQNPYL
jgi:hypothetical protein